MKYFVRILTGVFLSLMILIAMSCEKDYDGSPPENENYDINVWINPPMSEESPDGNPYFYRTTFRFAGMDENGSNPVGYFVRVYSVNLDFPDIDNPPDDPNVPPTEYTRWIWTEDTEYDVLLDVHRQHQFQVIAVDNSASWEGYRELVSYYGKASRDLMYSSIDQEIFLSGQIHSSERGYGVYNEGDICLHYYNYELDEKGRPLRLKPFDTNGDIDDVNALQGITPGVQSEKDNINTEVLEGANLSMALLTTGEFVDLSNEENLVLAPWSVEGATSEIFAYPQNTDPNGEEDFFMVESLIPQVQFANTCAEDVLVPADNVDQTPTLGQIRWNGLGPFEIEYRDAIPPEYTEAEGQLTHYSWSIDDTTTWTEWIPLDIDEEGNTAATTTFYIKFFEDDDEGQPIDITEDVYDLNGDQVNQPIDWYTAIAEGGPLAGGEIHTIYVRIMDDSHNIGYSWIGGSSDNPISIPAKWDFRVIHAKFNQGILLISDPAEGRRENNNGKARGVNWDETAEQFYSEVLQEAADFDPINTDDPTVDNVIDNAIEDFDYLEKVSNYSTIVVFYDWTGASAGPDPDFVAMQPILREHILAGGKVWLTGTQRLARGNNVNDNNRVFWNLFGVEATVLPGTQLEGLQGAYDGLETFLVPMEVSGFLAPIYREDFDPLDDASVILNYLPDLEQRTNIAATLYPTDEPQGVFTNFPMTALDRAEYDVAKQHAIEVATAIMGYLEANE